MAETRTNGVASSINGKPELQPIKVGQVYDNIPTALSPTVSSATTGVDKFDEIIPHPDEVPHRNLVLCFDGTGDQFSSDVSPYHPIRSLPLTLINTMPRTPMSSPSFPC